jgi:hypothetical protein
MKGFSSMAILLAVATACSNQPAPPPPYLPPPGAVSKPAASTTATPTAATAPGPGIDSPQGPLSTTPGMMTINQYDPPLPIPVSR